MWWKGWQEREVYSWIDRGMDGWMDHFLDDHVKSCKRASFFIFSGPRDGVSLHSASS